MRGGAEMAGPVVKPWRVLHACERVNDAALLAEVESGVGMRPQLLSREYWNPAVASQEISLFNAWHDVRDWRHALNEAEALTSFQIVHAHSFASAMAGVRGNLPAVYDFTTPLEEVATRQSHGSSGPWLLRSLRVAEQFALSRASAVAVHSHAMQKIAHERGAATNNIFVIPAPVVIDDLPERRPGRTGHPTREAKAVLLVLADGGPNEAHLHWFSTVASDFDGALLMMECQQVRRDHLSRRARELEIADQVVFVSPQERGLSIASADLVIAPPTGDRMRANPGMLQAMLAGRPVVAADVPENRECSQQGRGCLWFDGDNDADLAHRVLTLMHNRCLSSSLGENGRAHIISTRSPKAVGHSYDQLYSYAQARRSQGSSPKIPMPKMYALGAQTL